jgi:hypothetical protein
LRHRIRRFKVSRNLAVGEDLVRLSGVRALVEGRLCTAVMDSRRNGCCGAWAEQGKMAPWPR